jgi:hypothetical protein
VITKINASNTTVAETDNAAAPIPMLPFHKILGQFHSSHKLAKYIYAIYADFIPV